MEGLFSSTEELVSGFIKYLALGIDIMAAVIIGITITIAFISALKILRKPTNERTLAAETVRLSLARSLLLVLDFVVASDILKTILVPSLSELSLLAFIVAIRIALSWSLSKELARHTEDMKQ
ncbi:MAG: DUF1622 domain-containing protein [Nitrososphaeraceae archaeon]